MDLISRFLIRAQDSFKPAFELITTRMEYVNKHQSPLTADFPLLDWQYPLVFAGGYLLGIWLLVLYMKTRSKPYNVYYFALFHNIILTILSLYMCAEIAHQAYITGFTLFGNAVRPAPAGIGMANVLWIVYISKLVDFLDTVIMALKQNYHQITFLHLYHHASIVLVWWITLKLGPGGEAYFSGAINAAVHVIMYGYYLWATFARKLKTGERPTIFHPAFYRPYITRIQLIQFCACFIQSCYDIFYLGPENCQYTLVIVWMLLLYMISMLVLFGSFYFQAYVKKSITPRPIKSSSTAAAAVTNGKSNGKHD